MKIYKILLVLALTMRNMARYPVTFSRVSRLYTDLPADVTLKLSSIMCRAKMTDTDDVTVWTMLDDYICDECGQAQSKCRCQDAPDIAGDSQSILPAG